MASGVLVVINLLKKYGVFTNWSVLIKAGGAGGTIELVTVVSTSVDPLMGTSASVMGY